MNRKAFIKTGTLLVSTFLLKINLPAMNITEPMTFFFKDDGNIPNSSYPLLVYKNVFSTRGTKGADWLEKHFAANSWTNSWRWGVYPFHHYHSNTHEVLGCFSGTALLMMGGEKGEKIEVTAGDIIIIPAGVGHKCLSNSKDFTVVGAYPDGINPDLMRGEKSERPAADANIAKVKNPATDPYTGDKAGLLQHWQR